MRKPYLFAVRYTIGGQEYQTTALTEDREKIAEVAARIRKCRPDEVIILDVQWQSRWPGRGQ
jgi:thymidylate kinase